MAGEFLTESSDLFLAHRAAMVSPFLSLIGQNVGNFLVAQTFPRLHNRGAELLTFHGDRTLQPLENDHGGAARPAIGNFRTGQRRISLTL